MSSVRKDLPLATSQGVRANTRQTWYQTQRTAYKQQDPIIGFLVIAVLNEINGKTLAKRYFEAYGKKNILSGTGGQDKQNRQ